MVPVNAVASQGQPQLIISNLPPVSTGGAPPITEPRIYFGERASSYVIVDAKQPEFDYPRGVGDVGTDTNVEVRAARPDFEHRNLILAAMCLALVMVVAGVSMLATSICACTFDAEGRASSICTVPFHLPKRPCTLEITRCRIEKLMLE